MSISPCLATPRVIQNKYVVLNSFQDTNIELYLNEEDLNHDMSNGDFDLRIFFDGRSLLKEKTYPQNIKLEIYTLVDDDKSLVSLINRTIKNEKAAKNIFFAIKLPRIESTTELMFDIYDSHNMLNSTFAKEITINSNGLESIQESVPEFDCDAEDGECLLEYMLRHVTFSANYDRNLKTHVYKNDKGRYFVNIPIKKGRKLKKNVRGFNVSGGSGKSSGKNNSNFLDGYPFYEDGEEVSLAFWNDLRDAIQFSFKDSSDFMRFDKSGSLQLSTNRDKGFLNIAAGSSTKAPIVLNQGTLLDTLTEGAIEYDGNNLYFTNGFSRQVIGAQGPVGPPGPAGSQGPAGPAGAPGGGGGIDLSNGGFLNGNISFISTSMINNAVFNGSLQYRTGAVDGLVLTSDAAGNASWQSLSSLVNGGSGAISSGALGAIQFSDGAGGFSSNADMAWNNAGFAIIGDTASLTTKIGSNAGINSSGTGNNILGAFAGMNNIGVQNNLIGPLAGAFANGSNINALGYQTAQNIVGSNVNALGQIAARFSQGDYVNAIGYGAAGANRADNVNAIGMFSAGENQGNGIIAIGRNTLNLNNGDYNIAIGYEAGNGKILGDRNILLGYNAKPASSTLNGQLNIGDTLYGNLDTKSIAINKVDATPDANLVVNGSFQYTDGNEAIGFVLTSDALGQASWQSLTGTNGSANYWNIDSNVLSNTGASADETADDFIFGSPSLDNDGNSNHGNRFFFDKSNAALRSGRADDDSWNGANLGRYSLAFGHNSQAAGQSSLAFGNGVTANGNYSMVFGDNRNTGRFVASGENAFLRGVNLGTGVVEAAGDYSTVLGQAYNIGVIRATNAFDSVKGLSYGGDIIANGGLSHAEGYVTWNVGDKIDASGVLSTAKGVAQSGTIRSDGLLSTALGQVVWGDILAKGVLSHAESYRAYNVIANGELAYAAGSSRDNAIDLKEIASAIGHGSFARGILDRGPVLAKGIMSHALGDAVYANGEMSFVIGLGISNADLLQSDQGNSLTIGFNSNAATLFVGPSAGGSSTGNVGIGTNTPSAKLDILGQIKISDGSQANGFVLTSDANGLASWQAAGGGASSGIAGAVQFSDGSGGFSSNGDEFFWDDTNQRLGIARSSAQAALHVNGYALIGDSVNNVVALGNVAANSMVAGSQYVNALGDRAALGNNGDEINAFGRDAALNSRGNRINAFGSFAASSNQGSYVNALGGTAAQQNTGNYVNALGEGAVNYNIGSSVNALGATAGFSQNGDNVNALGYGAAFDNANSNLNAFGYFTARYNNGDHINAFGYQSAQGNRGDNVNAMGYWSGIGNSGDNVNAMGYFAARASSGTHVNAIGYFSAQRNFGDHVNAMGQSSAMDNKKDFVNALGSAAAGDNNGDNLNAFGQQTAFRNQGSHVNAIGMYSARFNLGGYVNAIGYGSTEYNDGDRLNAFGYRAGRYNNGDYINAIGYETLLANNGDYNIALGYRAGYNTRNGSENIMIGRNVDVANPNGDNQINIGNTIYGNGGDLGIGVTIPQRKLHISEAMRLDPQPSPPSGPSTGDLYVDSDGTQALCVYLNGAWVVAAGGGSCM